MARLDDIVASRLRAMAEADVVARIWERDHTVWKPDPTEITKPDRLGWLTLSRDMSTEVVDLEDFAATAADEGFTTAIVLGMGGSSLAPEVFARTFGARDGRLNVEVLDSTVPADLIALEGRLDLDRTLFIVASKSGTTIETLSHFAHFWEKRPEGRQFIAITDAGTPLATLAVEKGFRSAFLTADAFGGRYSAFSYFGLVPAALLGLDLGALLRSAETVAAACMRPPEENPAARLGAFLAEAALAGRDKLTLVLPPELASHGDWIEQLIAESTGKEGKGIIPIVGESLGPSAVYGDDRVFVASGNSEGLAPLQAAGQPVYRFPSADRDDLGGAMFLWEFATAVAGHVLQINAFDQPNVEAAKQAARNVLEHGGAATVPQSGPSAALEAVKPRDYLSLQAYLPRDPETRGRLEAIRLALRDRFHVATTLGFGPRYLHSTGQVHKGGPNEGVFLQLVASFAEDVPIPGRNFTFGRLNRAQVDGDYEALLSAGRRVTRTSLDKLEEALR